MRPSSTVVSSKEFELLIEKIRSILFTDRTNLYVTGDDFDLGHIKLILCGPFSIFKLSGAAGGLFGFAESSLLKLLSKPEVSTPFIL